MATEYSVVWRRKGDRRRRQIYQRIDAAERQLEEALEDCDPHLGIGTEHGVTSFGSVLDYARIETREVGEWQRAEEEA